MRTAPPHISHGNIESDKKRGAKKSDRFKSNIKPFSFFCLDVDLLFFGSSSKMFERRKSIKSRGEESFLLVVNGDDAIVGCGTEGK